MLALNCKKNSHCSHILAAPKKMIQVFLPLPRKNTEKRPHMQSSSPNKPIESVHTAKQGPNRKPNFIKNIKPPNDIEHGLSNWRAIQ